MKNTRIMILGLVFILLFTGMEAFAESDFPEADKERAKELGTQYGKSHGEAQGQGDFEKELKNNWVERIDQDEIILKPHEDKSEEFKEVYLEAYKKAYEMAYKSAYGEAEEAGEKEKTATIEGLAASLGRIHGEIAGFKDCESARLSNWERVMPSSRELDQNFDLKKIPSDERNLFLEEFKESFRLGYEDSYYSAHLGSKKDNMEDGREDGSLFATSVGEVFAIRDYHDGRSLDYNRHIPSEYEIIRDYSLNSDNKEYSEGFINGFVNSYQESYTNSYRQAKKEIILLDESSAYENGNAVGQLQGQIQANIDQMEKKTNNWKRSKALSSTIVFEYNLNYQNSKYMDGFINGYWDGYAKAYDETYKELSQGQSTSKTTSETIPLAGGKLDSLDGSFGAEIESGIYYRPVIMTIDSLNSVSNIDKRYIPVSNFYRLNIVNPSGNYAKDKKINIEFEYYGDIDGGIYQLDNGKWTYLTSTIEDGTISAEVNPSTIAGSGNVFAVLVDTETEVFHDIRGHWAKDEITTYIRRGVINGYGDGTFKPDKNISRAEFLMLVERLYGWYLPYDVSNNEFFEDVELFNKYNEKHISYSLSHGYILGYPDKYFKPYNPISYKEVDLIMGRILKDSSFKWEEYAEQMIYDKKVRSSSYDNYNNKITRAEFSYMLYKLNEWKH